MKKQWISLGCNAKEIRHIKDFVNFRDGELLQYIRDLHFPHYELDKIPSGRALSKFSKREAKRFLKVCNANDIKTTLLLNAPEYKPENVIRALEGFYIPHGLSSVVIS